MTTQYKNAHETIMTYTTEWILKHAKSADDAKKMRQSYLANHEWYGSDMVKAYERQMKDDNALPLVEFSQKFEKDKTNKKPIRRMNMSASEEKKMFIQDRKILYGDGKNWLSDERINIHFE